jgi:hypothetical protein
VADARQGLPRRHELVVDAELLLDLLDERDLIGGVVDDEVARQPDFRRLPPEQPRAERMKGRQPHAFRVSADQRLDALAHLPGGLVGEGDREHVVRLGVAIADEVGDAIRNDARLPRAGAGEDEQRAAQVQDGFALLRVQFVEEIHGAGRSHYNWAHE